MKMKTQMQEIMSDIFSSAAELYVEEMLQEYPILHHEIKAEKAVSVDEKVSVIRDRLARLQTDWDKNFVRNTPYYVKVNYQCPITGTYNNTLKVNKFHFLLVRNHICQKYMELRGYYPDSRDTYPITCKVLGNWWRCKLVKDSKKSKINLSYLDGHIQSVI
jgi:hypothetical protein